MPEPNTVVVVGGLAMNLVARAPRRPLPGESLIGTEFAMLAGGKGFNQAVTAVRCGAATAMLGCIGTDVFAAPLLDQLVQAGIDASSVVRDATTSTGIAFPLIEPDGAASTVIVPQANIRLTQDHIAAAHRLVYRATILLAQLEVPAAAIASAASLSRFAGGRVILNASPVWGQTIPPELYQLTDVLVANECEAHALTGIRVDNDPNALLAAEALRARGVGSAIITRGRHGALWVGPHGHEWVAAFPIEPFDAGGAGDAFCGALAAGLARGTPMKQALRYASAAGALATARMGIAETLPDDTAIMALLAGESDPWL
jgi:ribokinase